MLGIGLPVGLLAYLSISGVLEATAGVPAAPLDDAYIHFQFAKAFARGEPLAFSPGAPPVAGATSFLWPLLLAVPFALGLQEHSIVWAAWFFGFVALGLLAWEARRTAERFCSPLGGAGAAALVLAFGANTWFAASGMEVLPLAWLLLRSARLASEWCEGEGGATSIFRRRRELLLLAVVLPLMRPEGALGTALIAAVLALPPRGTSRLWSIAALGAVLVPTVSNFALTGNLSSTTARAKWLPLNPYVTPESLLSTLGGYVNLLFGTLLNGEIWSALFLPKGSAPVLVLSLLALPIAGHFSGARARGVIVLVLALGIFIPATYDCPLCNRLRYLWPFLPAWMIGTVAFAELVGQAVTRRLPALQGLSFMWIGGAIGALAGYVPFSMNDLATSARGIYEQQVSLGLWAREALPKTARIGINDAGAISYFSGRPTFDIVGLTTADEASYWTAGPGSRFEHYERLGAKRLPTHFIVYPEWLGIEALLGQELTARYVPDATILGGPRMAAHVADYSKLGSGEAPDPAVAQGQPVIDRLDVADLESESTHQYRLFDAQQRHNLVFGLGSRLDGGRAERSFEAFTLDVRPAGALVLRLAAESPTLIEVSIGELERTVEVPASHWHEARIELPQGLEAGLVSVALRARTGTFSALHYFSLGSTPSPGNP